MNVVVVSMAKDDQDVIESFVRYTLTFATRLVIGYEVRRDRTPQIVQRLCAEGLPITVDAEARSTTDLLAHVADDADWVIPLGADEFLITRERGDDVGGALARLTEPVCALPWRTYAPIDPHESEDAFMLSRPAVRAVEDNAIAKVMLRRDCCAGGDVRLLQGNHGARLRCGNATVRLHPAPQPSLMLARYFVRSPEQYASKIALSWTNTLAQFPPKGDERYDFAAFERYRREPTSILLPWSAFLPAPCEPADLSGIPRLRLRYSVATRPDYLGDIVTAREHLRRTGA